MREAKRMAKFSMKMKLQGFELEIHGDRTDIPQIAESVGSQFAKLMEPTAEIVEGGPKPMREINPAPAPDKVSRRKSRRTGAPAPGGASEVVAIDWRHDPSKWGSPAQGWSTADKAIWLLYVVEQEA